MVTRWQHIALVLTGLHSFTVFAQCLRASKPRVETHSTRSSTRNTLLEPTSYLAPLPQSRHSRATLNNGVFYRRQDVQSLRVFISASTSTIAKREKTNLEPSRPATEQRSSLIAVPVYESSPASIGIDGWSGYEEFIPSGAVLPCSKSITLVSAFDYIRESPVQVCGYLPGSRLRVDLADYTIHGIRKATKEKTIVKASMLLRTDLTGRFTTRFVPEDGKVRAEVSINFHGGQVLVYGDSNSSLSTQSGNFVIADGFHDAWKRV